MVNIRMIQMTNTQKGIGEVEEVIARFLQTANERQRKDLLVLKYALYSLKMKENLRLDRERYL